KSRRDLGHTDRRDRLVEIQLWNADLHQIHRKRTNIGAAELNAVNQNGSTLQTVILFENQLKDGGSRTSTRVGHETANKVVSSVRKQHDFDNRPIVLERPLGGRHQTTLQITSTRS